MKLSMIRILMVFLFLGLNFPGSLFGQDSREDVVLISSVHPQNVKRVEFELDGPISFQTWDKDHLRVEIRIRTNFKDPDVSRNLAKMGRYSLQKEFQEDRLVLRMEGIRKEVSVNGIQLEEKLSFQVFLPAGFQVDENQNNPILLAHFGY